MTGNMRFSFYILLLGVILTTLSWGEKGEYIHIQNKSGGLIEIEKENQRFAVGTVIKPVTMINPLGFRAAQWAKTGCVAAIGANGIHLKVTQREKDPYISGGIRSVLINILPVEYLNVDDYSASIILGSIITNIPAGNIIFGLFSPYVNNEVKIKKTNNNKYVKLPYYYSPMINDELLIRIKKPVLDINEIVFENRKEGLIKIYYKNGKSKNIAKVLQPVSGIGRFEGSQYIESSRVRANHPGVICISTSPRRIETEINKDENRGGFQIVPSIHASDLEMNLLKSPKAQWMIIKPCDSQNTLLEGKEPLFSGYIRPGNHVQIKIDQGEWEDLPVITGVINDAFTPEGLMRYYATKGIKRDIKEGVTHIRIILN